MLEQINLPHYQKMLSGANTLLHNALRQMEIPVERTGKLLRRVIEHQGMGNHLVNVVNQWTREGVPRTISSKTVNIYSAGGKLTHYVRFDNARFDEVPTYGDKKLTPQMARILGIDYSTNLRATAHMYGADGSYSNMDFLIGSIPVMLGSSLCTLGPQHSRTRQDKYEMGEDPDDPSGYWIIDGVEKVVVSQEQLAVDVMLVMANPVEGKIIRQLILTPDGTKLVQMRTKKDSVKLRLNSVRSSKGNNRNINVLRLFRMFNLVVDGSGITEPEIMRQVIGHFLPKDPVQADECWQKLMPALVELRATDLPSVNEARINPNLDPITRDKEIRQAARESDINYMRRKLGADGTAAQRRGQAVNVENEITRILFEEVFPNMNNMSPHPNATDDQRRDYVIRLKILMLAMMIARFLMHLAGFEPVDNRDSWSLKRVQSPGSLLEVLFRAVWRKLIEDVHARIAPRQTTPTLKEIVSYIYKDGKGLRDIHSSFSTANWGAKHGSRMKQGIVQPFSRGSIADAYAQIDLIDIAGTTVGGGEAKRAVQSTQFDTVDVISTPEGIRAGMAKNRACTAFYSLERSDVATIELVQDRVAAMPNVVGKDDILIVNGKILGWCNGKETRDFLVQCRRSGRVVYPETGIILNRGYLTVEMSPGRILHPILIVNKTTQRLLIDELSEEHKIDYWKEPIDRLMSLGLMEYISAREQEFIHLATQNVNLVRMQTAIAAGDRLDEDDYYTHCDIDPKTMLGLVSSLIIWANFNQSPRNTYQVQMSKQAQATYHINYMNRMRDGKSKMLLFPERPMIETEVQTLMGYDDKGMGVNAVHALITRPNNQEDAIEVKREFLDTGGLRMIRYFTYSESFPSGGGKNPITLGRPEPQVGQPSDIYKGLGPNGLPYIGAVYEKDRAIIGLLMTDEQRVVHNRSIIMKFGDYGIVDRVDVINERNTTTVIVKLRIMRIPKEGDKYAPSRCAQKNTIGQISSKINIPTNAQGVGPDTMQNTMSIPSRMTISELKEMLKAKACAYRGQRGNGSTFGVNTDNQTRATLRSRYATGQPVGNSLSVALREAQRRAAQTSETTWKGMAESIVAAGLTPATIIPEEAVPAGQAVSSNMPDSTDQEYLDEWGYELLRSGLTGEYLTKHVNVGYVMIQALRHNVDDKYQARSVGRYKPATRQPNHGRGENGGLRFGEMERDAAAAHGASTFLRERTCIASDCYTVAVCRNCGIFATVRRSGTNDITGGMSCDLCSGKEFGKISIPYALKHFFHTISPLSYLIRFNFNQDRPGRGGLTMLTDPNSGGKGEISIDDYVENIEDLNAALQPEVITDDYEDYE